MTIIKQLSGYSCSCSFAWLLCWKWYHGVTTLLWIIGYYWLGGRNAATRTGASKAGLAITITLGTNEYLSRSPRSKNTATWWKCLQCSVPLQRTEDHLPSLWDCQPRSCSDAVSLPLDEEAEQEESHTEMLWILTPGPRGVGGQWRPHPSTVLPGPAWRDNALLTTVVLVSSKIIP